MKYARELGKNHGFTAQKVNRILKGNGLLDGVPGNYTVTEKGIPYAKEQNHSCEVGGGGRCNGPWITRTWDDSIADKLDITENRKNELKDKGLAIGSNIYSKVASELLTVALTVTLTYGIDKATPYIKHWWGDNAVPSLKKMKNKATGKAENI